MKVLTAILTLTVMGSSGLSTETEGLYIPSRDVEPKYDLGDGEIVMRIDAVRLTLTQAVFRYDTEDRSKYCLEVDFTKMADSGGLLHFKIGGIAYTGFTVRGEGTNNGGARWALGFADPKLGRDLLQKIARIYDLPEAQILDQTIGQLGEDDQLPARAESES